MFIKKEFHQKLLTEVLPFWTSLQDPLGGYYGLYTINLAVEKDAPKGSVMAGRYLWTMARSFQLYKDKDLENAAEHAYAFIDAFLIDKLYGGVYWLVNAYGKPKETLKHTYAQSFAIYGLSEFALVTENEKAKEQAISLYHLIEEKAFDSKHKGYLEEFNRKWEPKKQTKIGSNHPDLCFTTNTHLHLLEAYTNLYRVWPDDGLLEKIIFLLQLFKDKITADNKYCWTEFDCHWMALKNEVSFGHDIETSWLLQETLDICKLEDNEIKDLIRGLAQNVLQNGIDGTGVIYNHHDFSTDMTDKTRVWWAHAEAVVGFYNNYQLTGDIAFLKASQEAWSFIENNFIDKRSHSEWFSRLDENNVVLSSLWGNGSSPEPISDMWKGPYHTVRMYLEMIKRLEEL